MRYTDFNREFVSRREAKRFVRKHTREKIKRDRLSKKNNVTILKTVYKILKDEIDAGECFVCDRGDNWSPRYAIMGRADDESEAGHYELFDIFEDSYAAEFKNLWSKTVARCRRRLSGWYESSCCYDSIYLLEKDKYEQTLATSKRVDFTKLGEL